MNNLKKTILVLSLVLFVFKVFGQKVNTLTKQEKKQGWVLLFDGKTPNGWTKSNGQTFPEKGWAIENGVLSVLEGQQGGDIITVAEYTNFDFSVDFLMTPTCNSGIKYFFTNYPKGGSLGMEYQLLDDVGASDNKKETHLCGSLYDMFPPDESIKKVNKPGEWNNARIVSNGKHVEHWLNGVKILVFDRGSDEYLAAVGQSKYKTDPVFGMVEKGHILLQDHGHSVSFRNIKIRKI